MKKLLLFIAILLPCIAFVSCDKDEDNDFIIGKWRHIEEITQKLRYVTTYTFTKDAVICENADGPTSYMESTKKGEWYVKDGVVYCYFGASCVELEVKPKHLVDGRGYKFYQIKGDEFPKSLNQTTYHGYNDDDFSPRLDFQLSFGNEHSVNVIVTENGKVLANIDGFCEYYDKVGVCLFDGISIKKNSTTYRFGTLYFTQEGCCELILKNGYYSYVVILTNR